MEKRTLNVGCGPSLEGSVRLDMTRKSKATVLGLALPMAFRDHVFDVILAENVLEHMPDPLSFLIECRRILRAGGLLRLVTDNYGYRGFHPLLRGFEDRHGAYRNPDAPRDRHYMVFGIPHVRNLLEESGFRIVTLRLFTRWRPTLIQLFWTWVHPNIGHSHIYADAMPQYP